MKSKGAKEAVSILQGLTESERARILGDISKKDPALAEFLEKNLLKFDDLKYLTTSMIQNLLREVKPETLGLALRGNDNELVEHFTSNVSRNIKADILDVYNGPLKPLSEVLKAREEIMEIVKKKIKTGEIVIDPKGSTEYV